MTERVKLLKKPQRRRPVGQPTVSTLKEVPASLPDDHRSRSERGAAINGFEPTDEHRRQISALVAAGSTRETIAYLLDTSVTVLEHYFPVELAAGADIANSRVASRMFEVSMGSGRDAVEAQKFWLSRRARWKEISVRELTGEDGRPISVVHAGITLSDEERATLLAQLINKYRTGPAGSTSPDD